VKEIEADDLDEAVKICYKFYPKWIDVIIKREVEDD